METKKFSKEFVLRAISNEINDSIRCLIRNESEFFTLVSDLTKAFNACNFSDAALIFSKMARCYSHMENISRCLEFSRPAYKEVLDNPSPSVECPSWISDVDIQDAAEDL